MFRRANWRMTIDEVKNMEEDEPVLEKEDILFYEDTLLGLDVDIMYIFLDNQLFKGTYLIREEYENKNNYLDDYEKLRKALIEKYGKPILGEGSDDVEWKNPLYKDEPHEYGFAVSIGHLEYYTLWEKNSNGEDTAISIRLSGENHDITLNLSYMDIELVLIWNERQKEKENSKL